MSLAANGIGFYFGGTLFEKYVLQGRFDDFRKFCDAWSCRHVEVSNGTIPLSNSEKASYIRKLAGDFTVVSEVGFKDPGRSEQLPPRIWAEYIAEDLAAGASLVTLEARESGRSGHLPAGRCARFGLIEDVLASGLSQDSLLFEAPVHLAAGVLRHPARARREPGQHPGARRHRPGDPPARAPRRHAGRFRVGGPMRTTHDVFHLAIPVHDLDAAQHFYVACSAASWPGATRTGSPWTSSATSWSAI